MAQREGHAGDDILIVAALCVAAVVAWWFFGDQIARLVYHLLVLQAQGLIKIYAYLPPLVQAWTGNLAAKLNHFAAHFPASASFGNLIDLMSAGGVFWVPLETISFAWMAWLLYARGAPRRKYRRRFDLPMLIREHARVWPALRPVVGLDLLRMDPDQGPWAQPKTEYQFAIEQGILCLPNGGRIHDGDYRKAEADYLNPAIHLDYRFSRERGRQVFAAQLSGYGRHAEIWSGFDRLNPLARWVCAVALSFLFDDPDTGGWLLDEANTHYRYNPKKETIHLGLPTRKVDQIISKWRDHQVVAHTLQGHYFTLSVITALYEAAKKKGGRRLVTARMRWLKTVDRVLWFSLNQIGRQVAWTEAAVIRAVLLVENDVLRYQKATGRLPEDPLGDLVASIRQAAIEESVYSLEQSLKEQNWFTAILKNEDKNDSVQDR